MTTDAEIPQDVGDEKQVRKRKNKRVLERESELLDIQRFCDDPANLYFLWRVLAKCGMFSMSGWADPQTMAVMAGKRDIGLWLLQELEEAAPDVYLAMKNAAQERKERMNERSGHSSYSGSHTDPE